MNNTITVDFVASAQKPRRSYVDTCRMKKQNRDTGKENRERKNKHAMRWMRISR